MTMLLAGKLYCIEKLRMKHFKLILLHTYCNQSFPADVERWQDLAACSMVTGKLKIKRRIKYHAVANQAG